MSLLGSAAMLLSFDIVPEAIADHDDWHTHEHLPERLRIPGFLRGSRWVATRGHPRYFVLYEVAELGTLTSSAYVERLNTPSAWTSKVMPHYRGMTRGLCSVTGSWGLGMGNVAYLVRFRPEPSAEDSLRRWLLEEALPPLPAKPGLGSAHFLQRAVAAPMTSEQRIRGVDTAVDCALLLMGYEPDAVFETVRTTIGPQPLERRGATIAAEGVYRLDYVLTHAEAGSCS
jgi:hypothetical protein